MPKVGPQLYKPIMILGKGSFGEVYLVRNLQNDKTYAMKCLKKKQILGSNLLKYAQTERNVLSFTRHPYIVGLTSAF